MDIINATIIPRGLTAAEVKQRIWQGQENGYAERPSRTYGEILKANIFTLFNGILATLLVLILIFGSVKDALFGFVLIFNSLIGIIQEVRAKRTLDKLALANASMVQVIRDGQTHEIPSKQVVLDDVIKLTTGDQIVVDGTVLNSEGLEIDESLLSGESAPILKKGGDSIYSGSFVVAGIGHFQTTKVGIQTYARSLAKEARQFSLTRSELITGINKFLRYVIIAMAVVAPFLIITQLRVYSSIYSVLPVVIAGLVGMVPQGLVLLTSIAFAISVISLGRRQVLVQELPAVEGLARVDVICFDKTGTLTTGMLTLQQVEKLNQHDNIEEVLQAFGANSPSSVTLRALALAFPENSKSSAKTIVPFSSERKWNAISLDSSRTWILGAPEVLLERLPSRQLLLSKITLWLQSGLRVLLLGYTNQAVSPTQFPDQFSPVAFLVFEEQVREDALATINYFKQQGVTIKIISGDNPKTVEAISNRAGVANVGEALDTKYLPENLDELGKVVEQHTIFGRVKPQQKRNMIKALQAMGHVVAMTGDGVNDVLALKAADLGIAMHTGASASKAVAQVVLLDGKFSTLPLIVAEGRKVIANIERVTNLFLTKTVYITLLAITVGIVLWPFPFLSRHLTLIDAITIGIPAFFLALTPNTKRYQPGFIQRVLRFVIPAGFIAAAATITTYGIARSQMAIHSNQVTTASLLALTIVGLWILAVLSRPLTYWRTGLLATTAGLLVFTMLLPLTQNFFGLELPNISILLETLGISIAFVCLLEFLLRIMPEWNRKGA